jgi:hypothetical protein
VARTDRAPATAAFFTRCHPEALTHVLAMVQANSPRTSIQNATRFGFQNAEDDEDSAIA